MKYHIINECKDLAFAYSDGKAYRGNWVKISDTSNDYICYNMDRTSVKEEQRTNENYCNQDCIIDLQEFGDVEMWQHCWSFRSTQDLVVVVLIPPVVPDSLWLYGL